MADTARKDGGQKALSTSTTSTVRRTKTTLTRALESKPGFSSIAGVYFFNGRGDVLVQRLYRDGIDHENVPALYRAKVVSTPRRGTTWGEEAQGRTPIVILPNGDTMLTYRPRHANVSVVAVTTTNANCMMVMQFLAGLVALVKSYSDGQFHEDVIKDNFILILELLDDAVDNGYPQLTDPALAKAFIFQKRQGGAAGFLAKLGGRLVGNAGSRPGSLSSASSALPAANPSASPASSISTMQVTGAVGWRDGNVRYKRNEVFLDIVESVSALLSSSGDVLRANVDGRIVMRSCLSGMPEVKLGLLLSDGVHDRNVQNVTFHPCVNLSRYAASEHQMLSFVPPDGEFELAKYHTTAHTTDGVLSGAGRVSGDTQIRLPFTATALMTEQGRTRIDVTVKVRSAYASNVSSARCVVLIPVPKQTARAKFQLSAGKAKYDPQRNGLVWKLKKFVGGAEHTLVATVELISTAKEREPGSTGRAPMSLHFQLPNLGVSGVQVRQLQVWEKSGYKVDKWVRWNTRSDGYEIRM